MKSIILIAAPAAGKGTEAAILKEQYNMPHISTGDLLRAAREDGSERAKIIAKHQDEGSFVPFEIVMELLKERIMKPDCDNGYILDGFPRDVKQADAYSEILKETGKDLGYVIVIDIDKNLAAARIAGRLSCPECKAVYNTTSNDKELLPEVDGICNKCGSKLVKRADDNEETYMERYNAYLEKTAPLIEYYEKLGVVKYVDGNKGKDFTHEQIVKILGE